MSTDAEPRQHFNLDTMSGVYPGTRSQIYQRLRLRAENKSSSRPVAWYLLHWHDNPPQMILSAEDKHQVGNEQEPLLTLPQPKDLQLLGDVLRDNLAAHGLTAEACFECCHWRSLDRSSEDGLPTGSCRWNQTEEEVMDEAHQLLRAQSALSLACAGFERRSAGTTGSATRKPNMTAAPLPRSAELDPDRLPFWPRLWRKLRRAPSYTPPPVESWATQLVERSGVGAGTEPCFVCQGRLANLGALAVESDEGDKQTFSIWRCRKCYTTYLNDWTDRWERLESLETEERYFRLAPVEAHAILHIIHTTPGGEHPARRQHHHQHRAQILAMLVGKQPLSHQIRQGR